MDATDVLAPEAATAFCRREAVKVDRCPVIEQAMSFSGARCPASAKREWRAARGRGWPARTARQAGDRWRAY